MKNLPPSNKSVLKNAILFPAFLTLSACFPMAAADEDPGRELLPAQGWHLHQDRDSRIEDAFGDALAHARGLSWSSSDRFKKEDFTVAREMAEVWAKYYQTAGRLDSKLAQEAGVQVTVLAYLELGAKRETVPLRDRAALSKDEWNDEAKNLRPVIITSQPRALRVQFNKVDFGLSPLMGCVRRDQWTRVSCTANKLREKGMGFHGSAEGVVTKTDFDFRK